MALQNAFGDVANDKTISDLYNMMGYFLDRLEFGMNTSGRTGKLLNVNITDGTNTSFLSQVNSVNLVSSIGTITTLTDQTSIGGQQAKRTVEAQLDTAFNAGYLSNITFA